MSTASWGSDGPDRITMNRLPPDTLALKVRVPCGCGTRPIPLQVLPAAVTVFREAGVPPDFVVASWYCRHCKWLVKITARHLHFTS